MPIISFKRGDMLEGQPITPGWYKGKIVKVGTETKGDRIDLTMAVDFEDPLLAQDERTVKHTFYNGAGAGIGFLVPLVGAIKKRPIKEIADSIANGETFDFDYDKIVGEKIQFKLINEPYQGRTLNKLENFLPYDAPIPQ